MRDRHCFLWMLSSILIFAPVFEVKAQVIPDNTLGKENSTVNLTNLLQRIDGGAIRGSNLFHSFKEFNIDSGKSVYFSNPTAIENILTRVTGKNPSNIFGKLGVLGNANLFLLNPNGIIFGENARLDISGSFTATTAESILFNNGFEFSATNPSTPSLLKVNLTPGLQLPGNQQGEITNQGNLTVGEDLNLIGKNLNLTGKLNASRDLKLQASDTLQIRDSETLPFMADAGRDLLLQGNQTLDIFALNHPSSDLFSEKDLVLESSNPVLGDARYLSGGSVKIEKLDGSLGDLESLKDPIVRASGDVSFHSYTGTSLHILAGGSVNITGDVTITGADGVNGLAETVTLSTGESLKIDGKNQATLDIRAGTTAFGIPSIGGSGNFTPGNPNTGGDGSSSDIVIGGNIRVETAEGLVFLTNLYHPNTNFSSGNIRVEGGIDTSNKEGGGRIIIDASGNISTLKPLNSFSNSILSLFDISDSDNQGAITLADSGDIITNDSLESFSSTAILEGSIGNGGAITLTAVGDITIDAPIESSSNEGNGGAITLTAGGDIITNALVTSSSYAFSLFEDTKSGNGGAITLTAGEDISTVSLDSSSSSIALFGDSKSGNGGEIKLTAGGDISTLVLDSSSFSSEDNSRDGGTIKLEANNDIIVDNIITSGDRNSGDIYFKSQAGYLELNNSFINSNATNDGNAGDIYLQAPLIKLTQTDITTTAPGEGKSGDIFLNSEGIISLDNSRLFTTVEPGATGSGGNIDISAQKLQLDNYSLIDTGTYSSGNAGNVKVDAQEIFINNNSGIFSLTSDKENAGNINLNISGKLVLTNNSIISTASILKSTGNSGDISISSDSLSLTDGSQLQALTEGTGNSGDINIKVTDTIDIFGVGTNGNISGIFISSKEINSGEGGDLTINAGRLNIINGGVLNAQNFSNSDGGNITINADTVFLQNGGQILADTNGKGKAGEVTINGNQYINIIGVDSEFENSPQIDLSQANLTDITNLCETDCEKIAQNQSNDSIATAQKIEEVDFIINNLETNNENVNFASRIPYVSLKIEGDDKVDYYSFEVKEGGTRATFDIDNLDQKLDTKLTIFDIEGKELAFNDNSSVSLGGVGSSSNKDPYLRYSFNKPGTYFIKVSTANNGGIPNGKIYSLQISLESTSIDGIIANYQAASGIFASSEGVGEAGTININTPLLNIADGAQVTVSSKGNSSAGNLKVDVLTLSLENQAKISAETKSGIGGNISLENLETLQLNNSQISASTEDGIAGNITVNASDEVRIETDSKIASEATGKGQAGSILINTSEFRISDGAKVTVSSPSGQAGNLDITADNLFLNQSKLTAETNKGESLSGANIRLDVKDLLMIRNNSLISAEAFDTANGGNITINNSQGFVIGLPFEDSDIIANAFQGNGGNIDITTQNIFGLVFRQQQTSYSDITASSEFGVNGQVTVNQLNVNPATDLVELPSTLEGATGIKAGCAASQGNNFIISSKGGLPQSPDDLFSGNTINTELFDLVPSNSKTPSNIASSNSNLSVDNQKNQIVEATGWVVDADGNIIFVAKMPQNNPHNSLVSSASCENFSTQSQ